MIKKYRLVKENGYDEFCKEFNENNQFGRKQYFPGDYSVFNIDNTTVSLINKRVHKSVDLTIGLDEKLINSTIEKIRSKGFELHEVTEDKGLSIDEWVKTK